MTTLPTNAEQQKPEDTIASEEIRAAREKRWERIRLLWNERRFLLRVFIGGILVSMVIALLIPSRYESTVRLMPPEQGPSGLQSLAGLMSVAGPVGESAGGLGGIAGQLLGGKDTGDLYLGVLRSRTLQDRLIDQFELKKAYRDKTYEDARMDLEKHTVAGQDKKSGIITISVEDSERKRATAVAGAYVAELNRLMTELNTTSGHRERVFLEGRLAEVKRDLESAEHDFSQYASKSGAIDITEQGKAMLEAAALLQGQYIAAESELEGLRQIYTDNNVRVRALEARVGELRHQLEKLGGKAPTAAGGNEGAQEGESIFPSIRELPLLGVTYADLLRRLKVEGTVFEVLTKEYELAKVREAGQAPSVTVLDPPSVPEQRIFPPRTRITIIGGIVALLLGIAFLIARERWNAIEPQDPGKALVEEVIRTIKTRPDGAATNGEKASPAAENSKPA